ATATLRKPVHSAAVYSALFVGINEFRRRRYLADRVDEHERRRLMRKSLVQAVLIVMKRTGSDYAAAYDQLRRESMRSRQCLEDFCETFIQTNGPELDEPQTPIGTNRTYAKKH
ncbi:MAG: ANTAR domain-containing protein, partial [Mesorhizobium sp.]|nr:ANTAR domain-containing protein [Mesorhizobium sp.]